MAVNHIKRAGSSCTERNMASYADNNMARFSNILVARGPYLQRTRIVDTRKKTHGDYLNIYGSEICSKGGNFFRQIVLLNIAPKHSTHILLTTSRENQTQELPYSAKWSD